MSHRPTPEQSDILDATATGEPVVVEALAGTGKTSTLDFDARARRHLQMTYVAFNRSIADEAQRRFPSNVTARTAHGFAFRHIMRKRPDLQDRLRNQARVPRWRVAQILRIPSQFTFGSMRLREGQLAGLAAEAVGRFCSSADEAPAPRHIPRVHGMLQPQARAALEEFLFPYVQRAWDDLCSDHGQLRFTHDVYLKLASMDPAFRFPGSVVLFDEAQDADPVVLHIVRRMQIEHGAQIIPVGDSNQQIYCQPPGTLVSVPGGGTQKIEDIQVGDEVVAYKDRRVFLKGRAVTGVTRVPYRRALIRVTLPGGQTSAYSDRHRCVVRFGEELRGKHAVYLMQREGAFRVGRTALFHDSVGGLFGPVARAKAERAEKLWILSVHESAQDAALAEALVSLEFGVPDVCFEPHGAAALDPHRFWAAVRARGVTRNLSAGVGALLAHGRRADEPFWKVGDRIGLRTPSVVAACNVVDGKPMLPLSTTVEPDRLSERKAPIQCWEPVVVSRESFTGELISLEVEDCHTYFADDILTHNSWRGASDALSQFDAEHRLPLTQSFRFGPRVADEANRILSLLPTTLRVRGLDALDSQLAHLTDPDTVLCRTNAEAVARLLFAQVNGVSAGLVGGTTQVEWLAKAALDLSEGRPTDHPELRAFETWAQVQQYVAEEKEARDLQVLVRLVDRHGPQVLLEAVERAVPEQSARLLISTAHKAKGREWNRVLLASDFDSPQQEDGHELLDSELRLAYVAVTRAKELLDSSSLTPWLDELVHPDLMDSRVFLPANEVPERASARPTVQVAQVMVDPESEHRVIMTGTKYDPDLVDAQRGLASDMRPSYRGEYCGFEKVRVVNASWKVMQLVERFGLTITDEARERILNYS